MLKLNKVVCSGNEEVSFQSIIEDVAPSNPNDRRLKTLNSLAQISWDDAHLSERDFIAVWCQLSDLIPPQSDETCAVLLGFAQGVFKFKKHSHVMQKHVMHFICNILKSKSCTTRSNWMQVIDLSTLVVECLDLQENILELTTLFDSFCRLLDQAQCDGVCQSVLKLITSIFDLHSTRLNGLISGKFASVLTRHLLSHADITCFEISSNALLTLLDKRPEWVSKEDICTVMTLVSQLPKFERKHQPVQFLEQVLKSNVWGACALRKLCEVSVTSPISPECLKLFAAAVAPNFVSRPPVYLVCDTLENLITQSNLHVNVANELIKVIGSILQSVRSTVNDDSTCKDFYSLQICDLYSLFVKVIESAKSSASSYEATIQSFLGAQIRYYETTWDGTELVNFYAAVDVSLEFVSVDFLVEYFEFLFRNEGRLDENWLSRFDHCMHRFLSPSNRDEMQAVTGLFQKLSSFVSSKVQVLYGAEILAVLKMLLSDVRWCELFDDHAALVFTFYFDYCGIARYDVSDILAEFCEVFHVRSSKQLLSQNRLSMSTFIHRTLMLAESHFSKWEFVSNSYRPETLLELLNKTGTAFVSWSGCNIWTPEFRLRLMKIFEHSRLLNLYEISLDSKNSSLESAVEANIVLGVKLLLNCLRSEEDWNVFEGVIAGLPLFLQKQDSVGKIFERRILDSDYSEVQDETISLGCTYLEQLVVDLCSLVDVKPTMFKFRFHFNNENSLCNEEYASYRSHIFQCLMCLVTYPLEVKSRRILHCFTNAVQDSKYGVSCLCALSVCLLECPDLCTRFVPGILDNICKVKSSRSMSVPALDLIFMLSQLPSLQHNLRCDDHKQIVSVILQFVDYDSYSKYCVDVALNLICVWFLKCKVSYRPQLSSMILRELKCKVENLQMKVALTNQAKSSGRTSVYEQSSTSYNSESLLNQIETVEKLTTKAEAFKSSINDLLSLQIDAFEVCMDVVTKHLYSETTSHPKRCEIAQFLLANGQSKSWIVNNRIVTITTSGNSVKLQDNGLCAECNERINDKLKGGSSNFKSDRQRHKSTPQSNKNVPETVQLSTVAELSESKSAKLCFCWVSRWAEVYVRTPTGDLSYLFRTQSQGGVSALVNSENALEKLGSFLSSITNLSSDYKDGSCFSASGSTDIGEITDSMELDINGDANMAIADVSPRKSIAGVQGKVSFDLSNLARSKSLDDLSETMNSLFIAQSKLNAKVERRKSTNESKECLVKKRHASSAFPSSYGAPRVRNVSGDNRPVQTSSHSDFSNPATVFYHLIASSQPFSVPDSARSKESTDKRSENGKRSIFCLPDTEDVRDEIAFFDHCLPFNTHKVGVLYVGEDQERNESAVLSNISGSDRYTEFIRGLGSVINLSECCLDQKIYNAGLDKSPAERDGKLTVCWIESLFQIMFHVATLIPTPDPADDPECNRKKGLLGNDAVIIVYNDSNQGRLSEPIIKTQLNFISIVVTPTDSKRNSVRLMCKKELEPWLLHASREEKVVSDPNLSVYVRQMALHASMACQGYLFREKNMDFCSNWNRRLELIRKMKTKFATQDDIFQ